MEKQKMKFNRAVLVKSILECLKDYKVDSFESEELNRLLAYITIHDDEIVELLIDDITVEI